MEKKHVSIIHYNATATYKYEQIEWKGCKQEVVKNAMAKYSGRKLYAEHMIQSCKDCSVSLLALYVVSMEK